MIIVTLLCMLFTGVIAYAKIDHYKLPITTIIAISISLVLYSIVYFAVLVLNLNFNATIISIFCANIATLFFVVRKRIRTINLIARLNTVDLFFIFLLSYTLYIFIQFSTPWGQWDAWAIWNLHAKFLYYTDSWKNLFSNKIAATHSDYPLMLPSIIALLWKSNGAITFFTPYLVSMLPLLGILSLLYCSFDNKFIGIISVLILVLDNNFITQCTTQYADTFLAFFYLLSIFLISNIDNKRYKTGNKFYIIGFIAATCFWIKNEGIIFYIFTSLALIFKYRNEKTILFQYVLGALPLLIVWGFFKIAYATSNDLIVGQSNNTWSKVLNPGRYIEIITFLKDTILSKFPILLLISIYIILSKPWTFITTTSFIIISLTLISYLLIYVVTPHNLQWHLITSLERLVHQLYPAILFIFFKKISLNSENIIHVKLKGTQ